MIYKGVSTDTSINCDKNDTLIYKKTAVFHMDTLQCGRFISITVAYGQWYFFSLGLVDLVCL